MSVDFNGIVNAHAAAQRKASAPKGWRIDSDFWPLPAFTATHEDYEADWKGEEDGWVGNGLIATGNTREELLEEIAAIEAEHPHFAKARGEA